MCLHVCIYACTDACVFVSLYVCGVYFVRLQRMLKVDRRQTLEQSWLWGFKIVMVIGFYYRAARGVAGDLQFLAGA